VTGSVRFHPLATAEVVEAQLWYQRRVDGLGDRFLDAVRTTTSRAARWPNSGTPTRQDESGVALEREVVVAGFPYVVAYRVTGSDLEILAVHHERRRPLYWADRATE
jgi:toxin ParE1/3/4